MSPSMSLAPLQPPAAKRRRDTSAKENDSDASEAEEAAPEPATRKKAVLKYKAPTKKVHCRCCMLACLSGWYPVIDALQQLENAQTLAGPAEPSAALPDHTHLPS